MNNNHCQCACGSRRFIAVTDEAELKVWLICEDCGTKHECKAAGEHPA